jgi:hypothetical protein
LNLPRRVRGGQDEDHLELGSAEDTEQVLKLHDTANKGVWVEAGRLGWNG